MADTEKGKRFSHLYVSNGLPLKDSKKARFRIYRLVNTEFPKKLGSSTDHSAIAQRKIEEELGIKFGTRSTTGQLVNSWEWYFNRISVSEFLDTITVLTQHLDGWFNKDSEKFLAGTRRIFKEENLAYEIDDLGGLHPLVDSVFAANKQSAIVGLDGARYVATAGSIHQIDAFLLQNPADYKGAIRASFGANENLFKLMYGVPRLDARTVGDKIGKDQQTFYNDHPVLQSVSAKILEGFKDWINAAHFYRHEEGVEEPNQPAEEVALLLISQGLSYTRWLAQLDKMKS